jgi:hypothetical protein
MNIVLYSNCSGNIIKNMFDRHIYTKDKFIINYIINYENLDKILDISHIEMLKNCDFFLYQPFNQLYTHSEYDISNLKNYLKQSCIILKINFYRFKGFWFESEYKPYNSYNNYKFLNMKYYGIHNSFINFNGSKEEIIEKINNLKINKEEFLIYFKEELNNFMKIDNNSDIKMYDYFINNYKSKHLFHDIFHPTNLFFYELFRQLVFKLTSYELIFEDMEFINLFNDIEMTHMALPILPIIKEILEIKKLDDIWIFYPPEYGDKKIYMNVYDYYYIRLSPINFQNYLDKLDGQVKLDKQINKVPIKCINNSLLLYYNRYKK